MEIDFFLWRFLKLYNMLTICHRSNAVDISMDSATSRLIGPQLAPLDVCINAGFSPVKKEFPCLVQSSVLIIFSPLLVKSNFPLHGASIKLKPKLRALTISAYQLEREPSLLPGRYLLMLSRGMKKRGEIKEIRKVFLRLRLAQQ